MSGLGDRLRERREALDVTRREVATAAGLNPGTVAGIERGESTRASTLRRIAAAVAELVEVDADGLAAELIEAAGGTLAAESAYPGHAQRIEQRRRRTAQPQAARLQREGRIAKNEVDQALAGGDMEAVRRLLARWHGGDKSPFSEPSEGGGAGEA